MKALQCPYEKAILGNQYSCEYSRRGQRGERALIECENISSYQLCIDYLKQVRHSSRFALKIDKQSDQLPFGKQSKLLYGSLAALQRHTGNCGPHEDTNNICMLMESCIDKYGSTAGFPYDDVVRHVASHKTRKRHGG